MELTLEENLLRGARWPQSLQLLYLQMCVSAQTEATLPLGCSQPVTKQSWCARAGLFLLDGRTLRTGDFCLGTPHWPSQDFLIAALQLELLSTQFFFASLTQVSEQSRSGDSLHLLLLPLPVSFTGIPPKKFLVRLICFSQDLN